MALEEFRARCSKGLMELLGTAVLVLVVQLASTSTSPTAFLAVGLAIAAVVYAAGPISGGHINPAVSFAIFIRGKMTLDEMLIYWLFQVIGGVVGALLGGIIGGNFMKIQVGAEFNLLQAFLAEFCFTAILCLVVLAVATNSKTEGNSYYGLAIGSTVFAGIIAVGQISGGLFNPAVAIGLTLTKNLGKIVYLGWVLLAELLGGLAGAALFYLVAPDEFAHVNEEARGLLDEARGLLPTRS